MGKSKLKWQTLFVLVGTAFLYLLAEFSGTALAAPFLSLTYPNGGEVWKPGTTQTIRWTYSGSLGPYVKIELLRGWGVNRIIASSAPLGSGGAGSFTWTVPTWQTVDTNYKIRITSTSNSQFMDMSDNYFSISNNSASPSITVTVPNGGEVWNKLTTQTIRWNYTGNPGASVKIELLKGGVVCKTLTTGAPIGSGGVGNFTWNIPSTIAKGDDYKIRVTSTSNNQCSDTSNSSFRIASSLPPPSITVLSPNGGETWRLGSQQTIRWVYAGNVGTSVKIELLRGYGVNRLIISGTSIGSGGSGSFTWTVPTWQIIDSNYRIRVTSTANTTYSDLSDGYFTITNVAPPSIAITYPNGGEILRAGSPQTIRWSYTGDPGSSVKIELLKGAQGASLIASSAPTGSGGSGSFSWVVPQTQPPGTDYRIRITSTSSAGCSDESNGNFTILNRCQNNVSFERWKGEYFDNTNLSGTPVLTRDDGNTSLNFDWAADSPDASCGVPSDNFSVRWSRTVNFEGGNYIFSVTADDGVRLWIDNRLLLDRWVEQPPTTYTVGPIAVSAGSHVLKMEYYEKGGGAVAKLSWQKEDDTQLIDFYGNHVHFLKMLGQFAFGEASEDTVVANRVIHAAGVLVDRTVRPNRIYVVDSGNNRILGFRSLGTCRNDPNRQCTNDTDCPGSICDLNPDRNADIIIGQPDSRSGACNGDSILGIYKNPTPSTLCLMGLPYVTNTAEYWMRSNFDIDGEGNLYIVDTWNNRVLKYNQPLSIDKSGGKGDSIADFVWGQDDFYSNHLNRGQGPETKDGRSIYVSHGAPYFDHVSSRGVSVDPQGNVWVADTFNSRILRFPQGSKTADLVLGQNNFTAHDRSGCSSRYMNRFCTPTLARINPETGDLYVLDEFGGFRTRIMVFKPPFQNGMSASKVIVPNQDGPIEGYEYVFRSSGFVFNNYKQGEYAGGLLWVNEEIGGLNRVSLIDGNGNILKVIGAPDKYHMGCDYARYGRCGQNVFANFNLCCPGGNVGFDNANNIYLADDHFKRIARFALPYNIRRVGEETCLPDANGGLFDTAIGNSVSGYKFRGGVGVLAHGNQLIVKDWGRYLVWENYLEKEMGASADFAVGQPSLDTRSQINSLGARAIHTVDDRGRMWTVNAHGKIIVYQLPFQRGAEPLADFVKLYWADDLTEVDYHAGGTGLAFDPFNRKLWLVDHAHHRLLRISNFDSPSNGLVVDMVIGQRSKNETGCNHNQEMPWSASGSPTAESLCGPTYIEFDRFGNLYVVENAYECHGNNRITVFMAEDLRNARGLFPGIQAKKVFVSESLTQPATCRPRIGEPESPVSIAFNSRNQMVVGNDGYYPIERIDQRAWRQLWFYNDPLKKDSDGNFVQGQKPDYAINIPLGAAAELQFDDQDNLIIQDHTWPRVWIINLDKDPSWLVLPER